MKRDICILIPEVKGEISKLYLELYDKTGKNRKLTNLLYALSQQDSIKRLFNDSDYNLLGEIDSEKLFEKLNVGAIIPAQALAENAARELRAIDTAGDPVYYDDIMTITTKVIDFNNEHEYLKAVIKHDVNGYHIEVNALDATNFNFNNLLENRLNLYDGVTRYLQSKGFQTIFNSTSQLIFNPLNIYYAIDNLKLIMATQKVNRLLASLMLDLMATNPLALRIIAKFGDDSAQAIALVSGFSDYTNIVTIDDYWREEIDFFIRNTRAELQSLINNEELLRVISDAQASTRYEDTYFGTNGLDVLTSLRELYRVYGLDKDSKNIINALVRKISDAANKLLAILLLQAEQLKGSQKKMELRRLNKIQTLMEESLYLLGITSIFQELKSIIDSKEAEYRMLSSYVERLPDSLAAINDLSRLINEQLGVIRVYSGILKELANMDKLEFDATESADLVPTIVEAAKEFLNILNTIEVNARRKQVDAVFAFMKLYWPEGEVKDVDGNIIKLYDPDDPSSIMNMAVKDPNILNRFIYAMNTSTDEMAGLIAEATKQAHERRDAKLRKALKHVRIITKELYDSGSDTKFMFVMDENGNPTEKLFCDYDFEKYNRAFKEYKDIIRNDPNIPKSLYSELEENWEREHTTFVDYEYTDYISGANLKLNMRVPKDEFKRPRSVLESLTPAQYKYWKAVMDMKASVIGRMEGAPNETLYDTIEAPISGVKAINDAGGNPEKLLNVLKNKILDKFIIREDSTEYGYYPGNGVKAVKVDAEGNVINRIPLFYTHKIEDRSRVSTDFSSSLLSYVASSENYIELDGIIDAVLVTKDYILTQRPHNNSVDDNSISAQVSKLGKSAYVTIATKKGVDTSLNGMLEDFIDREFYGKTKRDEGYLFGTKISKSRLIDSLVSYNSITGLSVNLLGAEANVLVGKLLMLIEAGAGEFFGLKDMILAEKHYFAMLPLLWGELNSNTKKSRLGLMMDYFDVRDEFYEKVKDTEFYKNGFNRIIGNRNLFFLYGIGEHLLHAEGMIAVLLNKKNYVKRLSDNKEVPLFEALGVEVDPTGNGELVVKEGYVMKDGSEITEEHLRKIKRKIAYVNKSMHGAFGKIDKGFIHRWAFGRVIMNFRQWMPAHYARRFRMNYFDTDLGEYREGYYISTWKFAKGVVEDLLKAKVQLKARWEMLSDHLKYNLKRAGSEIVILVLLLGLASLAGDPKDHKGNWARRHLIYEIRRLVMETKASSPVAAKGFLVNAKKILQSPFAMLDTVEKLGNILDLSKLSETIESGKYKGENKYWHDLKRDAPIYSQLSKMFNMGDDPGLFNLFN